MTQRLFPALGICLSLCLTASAPGLAGCGSTTTPSDTGTDTAAGDSAVDAAPAPADQCQNTEDLAWLKGDVGGGQTGRDLAREAAGDCGLGCLNHPAPDQCAVKCMVQDKGVKLSDGCAGCYGGIVLCTIGSCLAKCIDDAQAQICKDCQETKGCNVTFYACTGNLD